MQLIKKLIIIFLFLIEPVSFGQKINSSKRFELKSAPDKLVLMNFLRNRQYQTLLEKLDGYLTSALQDFNSEKDLWLAFETFKIPYSALEPFLNEMIKQNPLSSSAYAARALYYVKTGWNIRGYGWAKDVSQSQWDGMQKYFEKAVDDAIRGLNLNPQNIMCYDVLITIWMHFSDKQVIRMYLNEALRINPYSLQIRLAYMWSLLPRWGGSHEEMLQFAKESDEFATKNPKLKILYGYVPFDQGWSYEGSGDCKTAISFYTKALSYGEGPRFYEYRGDCYFELEDYQKALNDFDKALQLWPQNAEILRKKGMILHTLGRSDEARQILETASKISPTDRYIQNTKQRLDRESANDHISNGVELDRQGKSVEAILEYDLAVKEQPDDYLAYYNRGVALMKLGHYNEAIRDFEHAIARNVSYVSAYYNIGWILIRQNKLDDAILAYTRAITLKPDNAASYLNRSYAYYLKDNRTEAENDLKKACELGNNDACKQLKELRSK
jgi:tetratricopeptide (TPR) repeat protein